MCGVIEWSNINMKIFLIYLLLMNIAGFAAMGIDKCKAKAHAMAHPGEDIIWAQPAGRKRRYLGWDVCLQAQDKALVFCKGDAAYFFIHVVIACVIYRNFY